MRFLVSLFKKGVVYVSNVVVNIFVDGRKSKCAPQPKGKFTIHLGKESVLQINVRNVKVGIPPKFADDVVQRRLNVTNIGHEALQSEFVLDTPIGTFSPEFIEIPEITP